MNTEYNPNTKVTQFVAFMGALVANVAILSGIYTISEMSPEIENNQQIATISSPASVNEGANNKS